MGKICGENYEIILHDVSTPERSVVAVCNEHLSDRRVGNPMTKLTKELLRTGAYREHGYVTNYKGHIRGDRCSVSSTYFIREKGHLAELICVNHDVEGILVLSEHLSNLSHSFSLPQEEESSTYTENLDDSTPELSGSLAHSTILGYGIPSDAMYTADKLEILHSLEIQGIFQTKGSIGQVARELRISEPTVYRYLRRTRSETTQSSAATLHPQAGCSDVSMRKAVGHGYGALTKIPGLVRKEIEDMITEAVVAAKTTAPPVLPGHFHIEITYVHHYDAYGCSHYPGASLISPTIVTSDADDYGGVLRFFYLAIQETQVYAMAVTTYQYRSGLVDQIHRGHIAVADHTGKIFWKLGDLERLTSARPSAKPLQAILVAENGALRHYDITLQELVVICSSHSGEPFHVKAVESTLHRAGLSPDQLRCGSEYLMYVPAGGALKIASTPWAPTYCGCFGRHAGTLIIAHHLEGPLEGYVASGHPIQQRILPVFAEVCDIKISNIQLAVDGYGVPVHALPLYRLAQGYARMSLPAFFDPTQAAVLRRITSTVTAYPEMVAGTGRIYTQLMAAFGDRIFCKSGASASYTAGIKDKRISIALKMKDGASSIVPYAILPVLTRLGVITPEEACSLPRYHDRNLRNNHHTAVGRIELAFQLRQLCQRHGLHVRQSASVLLSESSINKITRLYALP